MKITKIHMKDGCRYSNNVCEIDSLFIIDCVNPGFYKKDVVYDYVKKHPGSIYVDRFPYPDIIPVVSVYGEKYVRSEPNDSINDNLLKLPRE